MIILSLNEIVKSVNGKLLKDNNVNEYTFLTTDSRAVDEGSIFLALKGATFNGNDFAVQSSNKGANLCIVDEVNFDVNDIKENTAVIKVDNCREALKQLAKYYRTTLKNIKVIGVTGSCGKTSTKDLICAILSTKYKVFKTEANYNNDIGLPLMVLSLDNSYDVAVLEMGMSDLGEIHDLTDICRPHMAIITNIGICHIERLKTRENIRKAKLEITDFFDENSILVINGDDDLLGDYQSDKFKVIKVGFGETNAIYSKDIVLNPESIEFDAVIDGKESNVHYQVNIPGKHNVINSLFAMQFGRMFGITEEKMREGLLNLKYTSMRLDIIRKDNYTVIDDTYNAAPDSMRSALEIQANIECTGKRVAVFGTMKQLGDESYRYHKEVAQYAKEKGIDILVTVGEYNLAYGEGFNDKENFYACDNNENAIATLKALDLQDALILLKASRGMKFEEIVAGIV